MKKKFDETRPIYLQIMEEIKKAIVRGELKLGEKMVAVRELANRIGVNPNTAQRAYMELEREAILVPKRGQGTFITENNDRLEQEKTSFAHQIITQFLEELKNLGLTKKEVKNLIEKSFKEE